MNKLTHEQLSRAAHGSLTEAQDRELPTERSVAERCGLSPILSKPIPRNKITADTTYLLVDPQGRFLVAKNGKTPPHDWNYAKLVSKDDHWSWIYGITFNSPATQDNPSSLLLGPPYNSAYLHANGSSTNWEWAWWGDESWSEEKYPQIKVYLAEDGTLTTCDGTQALCADDGGNVYIGNREKWPAIKFTLHTFFLTRQSLFTIAQNAWPRTSFTDVYVELANLEYELVTQAKIQQIYKASGLSSGMYTTETFECDDFSYVLKAAAARQSYIDTAATQLQRGYAVGLIFGQSKDGGDGHAVNFFVDYAGNLKLIEPQNGSIQSAELWNYTPTFMLI
jgi:hypothetical protein